MNYKLAKQLYDAGYPLTNGRSLDNLEFWEKSDYPSLSELIEACGDDFHGLWNTNRPERWDNWSADTWFDDKDRNITEYGKTPEEAVAKLWLALQSATKESAAHE